MDLFKSFDTPLSIILAIRKEKLPPLKSAAAATPSPLPSADLTLSGAPFLAPNRESSYSLTVGVRHCFGQASSKHTSAHTRARQGGSKHTSGHTHTHPTTRTHTRAPHPQPHTQQANNPERQASGKHTRAHTHTHARTTYTTTHASSIQPYTTITLSQKHDKLLRIFGRGRRESNSPFRPV